jgi:hypothetical protein
VYYSLCQMIVIHQDLGISNPQSPRLDLSIPSSSSDATTNTNLRICKGIACGALGDYIRGAVQFINEINSLFLVSSPREARHKSRSRKSSVRIFHLHIVQIVPEHTHSVHPCMENLESKKQISRSAVEPPAYFAPGNLLVPRRWKEWLLAAP